MSLLLASVVVVIVTLVLQVVPGGQAFDCLSPLLTAVGVAGTRKATGLWLVGMALVWSVLARFSCVGLLAVWGIALWVLRAVGNALEYDQPLVLFVTALLVSLLWQGCVLGIAWLGGTQPTLDGEALVQLLLRPLTSGILCVLFAHRLLGSANPRIRLHHHH